MSIAASLTQELLYEAGNTRKLLARAPNEHLGWKPHAKSMTLGELAVHVADIPNYVLPVITTEEFAFDPEQHTPKRYVSAAELVAAHDAAVKAAEAALNGVADEQLMVNWSLKTPTATLFTLPRVAVLRSMVLNHWYHHRGQLTVYLRMKDVPLPETYGPSADEG